MKTIRAVGRRLFSFELGLSANGRNASRNGKRVSGVARSVFRSTKGSPGWRNRLALPRRPSAAKKLAKRPGSPSLERAGGWGRKTAILAWRRVRPRRESDGEQALGLMDNATLALEAVSPGQEIARHYELPWCPFVELSEDQEHTVASSPSAKAKAKAASSGSVSRSRRKASSSRKWRAGSHPRSAAARSSRRTAREFLSSSEGNSCGPRAQDPTRLRARC